jgi:hypothetical protein
MASPKYIIVSGKGLISSCEMAKAINRELWFISRPIDIQAGNELTQGMFTIITHPVDGRCAMCVNLSHIIHVHPQNNITKLTQLMGDLPQQEKEALAQYISSVSEFPFGNIIPKEMNLYDEDYMLNDGWFGEQD